MVLPVTKELIEYLDNKEVKKDYRIISSYVYAIITCGSLEDAQKITTYYISRPVNAYHTDLLSIIKELGDYGCAYKVFDYSFRKGMLKDEMSEEVLELIGFFQIQEAKPILIHYAFDGKDYYECRSAIFGLLHFDCSDIQDKIILEIEGIYNKSFFNEYLPVLVSKLKDPRIFLEKLYELGSTVASTDCNGGIVLAFALCGELGRPYFRKVLFDPYWETYGSGTGTDKATYQGIKELNIKFVDLYQEIKKLPSKSREQEYSLHVLFVMLSHRVADNQLPQESLINIYEELYGWKTPNCSDNIIDLCKNYEDLHNKAYQLERAIENKMKEELILQNFNS